MQIFNHGNDRGNAVLTALILILLLSGLLITITGRIFAKEKELSRSKIQIINSILQNNSEIRSKYEFN